jgi:PHP family Zn ribbon phosphoesterase
MNRVEELADRAEGEKPPRWRPYDNLIPLPEIIADAKDTTPAAKGVDELYFKLLSKLGNEMYILKDASLAEIEAVAGDLVTEGIKRMREGKVHIDAGYDGEYGKIKIFSPQERGTLSGQLTFFE